MCAAGARSSARSGRGYRSGGFVWLSFPLLTPYLELHSLSADVDGLDLEINTDGSDESLDESFVSVLHKKTSLTDTYTLVSVDQNTASNHLPESPIMSSLICISKFFLLAAILSKNDDLCV